MTSARAYRHGDIVRLNCPEELSLFMRMVHGYMATVTMQSDRTAYYYIELAVPHPDYVSTNSVELRCYTYSLYVADTMLEPVTQEEFDNWILEQELTR